MGNLLKLLNKNPTCSECSNVFLDFENAKPTNDEIQVFNEVSATLGRIPEMIRLVDNYQGASDLIRRSIANPSDKGLQEETWNTLNPLINIIKTFYDFSYEISAAVPKLLKSLCSGVDPIDNFEKNQALAKSFAEIIDFTLHFDEKKMSNPSIQNDLSYYRRIISCKRSPQEESQLNVNRDLANKISIFLADSTPFMSLMTQTVCKYFGDMQLPEIERSTSSFITLACLCKVMIENPDLSSRFQHQETRKFCLRVMVGLLIVIDHVNPNGIFGKASQLDIRPFIRILQAEPQGQVECLLNALRYSTKHLNDPSTPKSIKQMLA